MAGQPQPIDFLLDQALSKSTTTFVQNVLNASLMDSRPEQNFVTCPIGLLLLLSTLLGSGAPKQSTATQIASALGISQERDSPKTEEKALLMYQKLSSSLISHRTKLDDSTPRPVITLANGIFFDEALNLNKEYTRKVKGKFEAEIRSVDFSQRCLGQITARINKWAEKRSGGLIPELFTHPDGLKNTQMLLLNMMTFKDNWLNKFLPETPNQFVLTANKTITVPMMTLRMNSYYINRSDLGFHAIKIPMQNQRFSFVVAFPSHPEKIQEADKLLSGVYSIKSLFANSAVETIRLTLPKFKVIAKNHITAVAKKMGIHDLFESATVDLTGLMQGNSMVVNKLEQSIVLSVDENGVQAAMATSASDDTRFSLEPTETHDNHQFMCIIYDLQLDIPIISAHVRDVS